MNTETAKLRLDGLRQKEVAHACGVTTRHLRAVLSGERESKSLLLKVEALRKK